MTKKITDNQVLGELGETVVKKLVLEMGMIYEHRGRFEAGIDGLVELRDPSTHAPLGKLLGARLNRPPPDSTFEKLSIGSTTC